MNFSMRKLLSGVLVTTVLVVCITSGTAATWAETALKESATPVADEYDNLLVNGDFEQGDVNWSCAVPGSIKPGIGKDGGYGLELKNPVKGTNAYTFYTADVPVLPGTTYEISFDYIATPNSDFRMWSGGMGLMTQILKTENDTVWRHTSKIFTTPSDMTLTSGEHLAVMSKVEGITPAVVDNVCLRLYNSGVEAESVTMDHNRLVMIPGSTADLTLVATPFNGDTNCSAWVSSDENVATVEYGAVTAVGKGTATITAATKSGKTASCQVTVSGEKALINNGSFDIENDDSWVLSGGTVLEDGKGRANSTAAVLTSGASVSQRIDGLQPGKTYRLSFRYHSAAGHVTATLTNGAAVLLEKTANGINGWARETYEFIVPEAAEEEDSFLTLTTDAAGTVCLDNVVLAQAATHIDFTVRDIAWNGGDGQVPVGAELLFAVTVVNQGVDPVPAGSVIEVDIAVDGEVIRTLTHTCSTAMETDDSVIIKDAQPWAATEGALVVSARANPRLSILETNSVNNADQAYLRVADEPLPVPEIAQQVGMDRLIFSDEFDSIDSIDTMATGAEGYKWYVTRNWSAGTVTRDAYDVEEGILTLKNPNTYGITLTSVDVNTHNGFSWNKGYLEVRLRIPNPEVTGGGPNVWSLPLGKIFEIPGENNHWVEIDWMEFWGIVHQYDKGYWTVTLHDQTLPEGANGTTEWYANTHNAINALGDKEWHTLGWVWDENLVQAYMDGVMMYEITYAADVVPVPLPDIKKGELKDGIFSVMNEQELCLMLSGIQGNPLEVDYVRIWQDDGVDDAMEMTAEDFWYNYCTDDWGDPVIEVTEENYQNILNGEEIWEQLSDERRGEINALLAEYGQPNYGELLADALIVAEGGIPSTGESVHVLSTVAVLAMLSAAVLWVSRKRRKA